MGCAGYALLLIDRHPQAERTRNDHIALVEISEQLDTLPREFDSESETVVDIALEHFHMIFGIHARGRILQFVLCVRWEAILGQKSSVILDLVLRLRSIAYQRLNPTEGPGTERKQHEH